MQGGFFAESLIPTSIVFITSTRFVITEKKKATLFEIDNFTPRMIKEFETESVIVAALPTNNRNQFGLVEENGKLRLCDIEL